VHENQNDDDDDHINNEQKLDFTEVDTTHPASTTNETDNAFMFEADENDDFRWPSEDRVKQGIKVDECEPGFQRYKELQAKLLEV
jgi:hypothetical protein